jgi:Lhr-like helicase
MDMRSQAENWLRKALDNKTAQFREGQWECIEALLRRERLLVVQRTGWGKSLVYFLAFYETIIFIPKKKYVDEIHYFGIYKPSLL